ncbi:MAG: FtsX-like permease family protein [Chloroflexota bacterium]|nr:FtsX-like permease family protein [Chloroflexota bacterium]
MIWKNITRRKGRTFLTVLGIALGVAAIVGLGALAEGMEAGYSSMLSGSQADLVISQPNSFDISFSSVEETVGPRLRAMPEVSAVSGMMQGFVPAEEFPYFFIFGYPADSFVLERFQVIDGDGFNTSGPSRAPGNPILLGLAAAEAMGKSVGDTIRLSDTVYRIIGIFQTGDAFEDGGAVLPLDEAQQLLGKPRQVSLFYIQLKDPQLEERFSRRVEKVMPDLDLSGTANFADKQIMGDALKGTVWAVAGLAIVIGGVGMMNAQLMAVYERTREIGVLKALGWPNRRILWMIFGESLMVCLAGGLLGVGLGYLALIALSDFAQFFGASSATISSALILQAFAVVFTLGLVAGLYPAWRASLLEPVEAMSYEGGTASQHVRRFPIGGMAVQSLWQRTTRTFLTLAAIGLTTGGIMALDGMITGAGESLNSMAIGAGTEIMVRQSNIADTSLSALDQRIGARIAAFPEVENVSGMVFSAVILPEANSFFILQGYSPNEYAIRRYVMDQGQRIDGNHQIMLGMTIAEALNKGVGDTIELSRQRFRVVGIYESDIGWEGLGGVMTLRDAQAFIGRPRKVTMYAVKVHNPADAPAVVDKINTTIDGTHAALAGEFAEQMPDMEAASGMMDGISALAIMVGGIGVMNSMLMAVLERTREIGVLRAVGWSRFRVLGLIFREALLLGLIGGVMGVFIAFGLVALLNLIPTIGEAAQPIWTLGIFTRAFTVALLLGLIGGLYPALRATRLEPVEALRYE